MRSWIAWMAAAKRPFVLMALFGWVAAMLWAAGNQKVVEVSITPGQVTWRTIAEAEGWLLTVSGQGIYLRERYEGRAILSLRPVAPETTRGRARRKAAVCYPHNSSA